MAIDPANPDRSLATHAAGRLRAFASTGGEESVPDGPALTYLNWPTRDSLIGLAPDGTIQVSRDGGASWRSAGAVPGQPPALETNATAWYGASDAGLFTSAARADSWTPLFVYRDAA